MDGLEHCLDKNHYKNYPYQIFYDYNSRGFRDREWPQDLTELKKSIWCVGDSFTVGLGCPRNHIWPYLLEQKIGIRTINVSMDGASNQWIERKVIDILEKIDPDILIIQWSYVHRGENPDTSLSDEERRRHVSAKNRDPATLVNIHLATLACIKKVEAHKKNTRVIHSFIPKCGLQDSYVIAWHNIQGPSWPKFPENYEEFQNLDSTIIQELDQFGLLQKFQEYFEILKDIEYLPEISQLDLARDGHHYDLITAQKFVGNLNKLLNHGPIKI